MDCEEESRNFKFSSTVINNWQNDQTELNKKMVEKKLSDVVFVEVNS